MLARVRNVADEFQQRHAWLAFPYGVLKKFGEDRGGQQAALLAYYGFFSLFPLLLVAVTVLGMLLRNNPGLEDRILSSALSQFPIIGDEIHKNLRSMGESGTALIIGVVGALWGGLGGFKALQNVMDNVWDIPVRQQANTVRQIVRALMTLGVFTVFGVVSTGLAAIGTATERFHIIGRIVTLLLSAAVNVGLFMMIYRFLTVAEITWRDVIPGAVFAGVGWSVLLAVGNFLVARQLARASELYGFFGIVLGLISWMYLGAQLLVYAAEINAVKKLNAWPRSLSSDNLTPADRRILARHAESEERVEQEEVGVAFNRSIDPDA